MDVLVSADEIAVSMDIALDYGATASIQQGLPARFQFGFLLVGEGAAQQLT